MFGRPCVCWLIRTVKYLGFKTLLLHFSNDIFACFFFVVHRKDLVDACDKRDLTPFHSEFDF